MICYLLFNMIAGSLLLLVSILQGKKPVSLAAGLWLWLFPAYGYGSNEFHHLSPEEVRDGPGKKYFIWHMMLRLHLVFAFCSICYGVYLMSSYNGADTLGYTGSNYLGLLANEGKNIVHSVFEEIIYTFRLWFYFLIAPAIAILLPLSKMRRYNAN